jgi:predicted MFS family arabinose efflux permease
MKALVGIYLNSFRHLQRNIWILAIANFINRSGAMVLLFTSLYLTKILHFSIAEAGIIMSFYGMGSVLGSYAGGWLTDRMDTFRIMFCSLIASGSVLLLMLVAERKELIMAVMFTYAFVSDIFRPANSAAMATYSNADNRTRSVSLIRLAVNLGFSVGPAVGGFVALWLGYHWLFIIDAATSIAAAFMLYIYLPKNKFIKTGEHHAVLANSETSAYRDKLYLFFILLVALFGICFFQLFASIPQYFSKVCKYNEQTIGLLLALNGLLVVIIEMPLIAYIENKQHVFSFIIAGVLCLPIAFSLLLFGREMMVFAIIYTLIITLSEILAMPFMMNYALSRPKKARQGQYSALYSISYGIANIAAPSIGLGIAAAYGFNAMFVFLITLSALTAIGFGWLRKHN